MYFKEWWLNLLHGLPQHPVYKCVYVCVCVCVHMTTIRLSK
jgi:hypothetical protein